jgi:hypothetical protein
MFSSKPMQAKFLKIISITVLAVIIVLAVFIVPNLQLPKPTGKYVVSQTVFRWLDTSRSEVLTEDPHDSREVIATIWYPAEPGTGAIAPYFSGLSTVSNALIESGEVAQWEVIGLQFIRSQNLSNAELANDETSYPVMIFSPGNGTNIEFYTILASEIASQGYIVIGLNHPYDVAAVELSNGEVAPYNKSQWSLEPPAHQAYISERIKVRTADILFVLDQLEILNSSADSPFDGRLDLDSVAVGGHSLGGITASEACKADMRFRACLNFDGLQEGGPFSTEPTATPPLQPFMFLTKEVQLHPRLIESFESTRESYWVVIHGASHESFTDGTSLQPSIFPGRANELLRLIEEYTVAFLDHTLRGEPPDILSETVHQQNVSVKVYP